MSASRDLELDPDRVLAALEGETRRIRLGLERMLPLLASFGEPHRACPAVLVAGTNGKGSTAALLAAIATASGYRTGLFTSPHLERVSERLRLDGRAIPAEELGTLLGEIVESARRQGLELPTYFEAVTLAAFVWFARRRVELAVLEVGMGGRLDATNVAGPILSVITEIGLDHQAQLGDTLAQIAREKAGILRPGVPAVTSATEPEAVASLASRARQLAAPLVTLEERAKELELVARENGQSVRLVTDGHDYHCELRLLGEHQGRNLALALVASEILARAGFPRIEPAAAERGASACRWPGRLERVRLPTGKEVWLDGAHNAAGAEALERFLAQRLATYDLLLALRADKDARAIVQTLSEAAGRVVLTRLASDRGFEPEAMAKWAPGGRTEIIRDPSGAIEKALAGSRPLVICGSLYLVGWARAWLRAEFGRPASAADTLAVSGAGSDRSDGGWE